MHQLPVDYNNITRVERSEVREQYVAEQGGDCFYCGGGLEEDPPARILRKDIDWRQFPQGFLDYHIHLQHNHETGLTEGAVHSYCNAVMWQHDGR